MNPIFKAVKLKNTPFILPPITPFGAFAVSKTVLI
jgi:hypothetical protein